jgi:hypothetical protein
VVVPNFVDPNDVLFDTIVYEEPRATEGAGAVISSVALLIPKTVPEAEIFPFVVASEIVVASTGELPAFTVTPAAAPDRESVLLERSNLPRLSITLWLAAERERLVARTALPEGLSTVQVPVNGKPPLTVTV